MSQLIPLSTMLNEMNRYQAADVVEKQYKVKDIDNALRAFRRKTLFPWTLKKGTLRVFSDVLLYPVADDHDEMAFFDNQSKHFSLKPQTKNTTIKEFFENPDTGNDLAEIWDNGTRLIGLRYLQQKGTSQTLSTAEVVDDYSVSGDATAVAKDDVIFKEGNASMRVDITNNTNETVVTYTFSAFSDSVYKRKYKFIWVKFGTAPTSVELRLRSSAGNYIRQTGITTQFSGQTFKDNDWNLLAFDLNTAEEVGTFDSDNISSGQIVFTGAPTDTYYIDTSSLKGWELLDYWYYSKNLVALEAETVPSQAFFQDNDGLFLESSKLICDDEWRDAIIYTALMDTLADQENGNVYAHIGSKQRDAMQELMMQYPHLKPLMTTTVYNFTPDPMDYYYGRD